MNEFELIKQYFQTPSQPKRNDVILGIGDDAAILQIPPNKQLITTVDTLVENIHFFADTDPADIAYKALAVNLSDLAAMATEPAWFTLALTLPTINESWLAKFSAGLFKLAQNYQVQLIGGDTTHGPLSITIQTFGFTAPGQAIRRDGAKSGDLIYVTGEVGTAAFALTYLQNLKSGTTPLKLSTFAATEIQAKLLRPTPRVREALAIQPYLHAAIDISDGLAADLNHILTSSQVGATLWLQNLPISPIVQQHCSAEIYYPLALSGGDDYELCFTIAAKNQQTVEKSLTDLRCPFRQIGQIDAERGLRCVQADGQYMKLDNLGYQHF